MEINWIGIFASAIASFMIGALWYSPLFLGKQWARSLKKELSQMKHKASHFITSFTRALLLSLFLCLLFSTQNHVLGFLILIVFLVLIFVSMLEKVWYENRPTNLAFIDMGYYLVSVIVSFGILYFFCH